MIERVVVALGALNLQAQEDAGRAGSEFLRRQVHPQVPSAFYVLGGERLAVMELDALA